MQVLRMPLPPFHLLMHIASCQAKNALNRVPAGGLGLGEPTEQLNRFLGLAGVVLQYTTLSVRALWLEVLISRWNEHKRRDLPRVLVQAACRAVSKAEQLQQQQTTLASRAITIAAGLQASNKLDGCLKDFVDEVGAPSTEKPSAASCL